MIKELLLENVSLIQDKIYDFDMKTKILSEWAEDNIYLTTESKFAGPFSFKYSPYAVEVVNNMMPNSGVEITGVMKCSQSGFTQSVVIPCLVYHAAESPTNQMFITGSDDLVTNTIRGRFDTVMDGKNLKGVIKSSSTGKKANQRTGDTDKKKEYTGGSLVNGTYKPGFLRFHSIEVMVCDEYDDAKKTDKTEGSIFDLVSARTKAYADTRRMLFISSPTTKGISNIEGVYNIGDKRIWNWKCPHCQTYIPILFRVEKEDGSFAGIKWQLDDNNELIEKSVHYECQNCGGRIDYKQKYSLNLTGMWVPTAVPKKSTYRSYRFSALCNPPGFESWIDLARQWIDACPKGEPVDIEKLKVFTNTQLGELWEDRGTTPKMTELMNNVRRYEIGIIPDKTCEEDGNGKIALITLSCDLGGIMDLVNKVEDVRLDWEIVAHTSNGQQYSIDHGSIGTFKRSRNQNKKDRDKDSDRVRWTFKEGVPNSVWPVFKEQIYRSLQGESDLYYDIDITIIDTGHFTKLAYNFIQSIKDRKVLGIKGDTVEKIRSVDKNTAIIKHSSENKGLLYIIDVNKLKDNLSHNMSLTEGTDGTQPNGFMNFPQPSSGKYNKNNFFDHYESEHRVPDMKNGVEVGFIWKKKRENNHFWDVAVYNLAAKEIFIADLKLLDPANRELTWQNYCDMINE
jgi:phage terminase large subunit GpA-like protein